MIKKYQIRFFKKRNLEILSRAGIFLTVFCIFTANFCWGFGESRRAAYSNQSNNYGLTFEKPSLILPVAEPEPADLDPEEKQMIEPVSTGWTEATGEASHQNRKRIGLGQLIDVINKLFNGIGSVPMIPFAVATDGGIDTIRAYALGEERTGSVLDVIRHQLMTLASFAGYGAEFEENIYIVPNLNEVIGLLI